MRKYPIVLALALLVGYHLSAQTKILSLGSSWKYATPGKEPDMAWQQPDFPDTEWAVGAAILGYGNLNEATLVSYGPDATQKYTTTYFRKAVTIDDPNQFSSFTANIKRDDGAVVYVNGSEVFRSNLPAGSITYATLAALATDDGRTLQPFTIPVTAFQSGVNVIAVEIHQASLTNPDLAFDLTIEGNQTDLPSDEEEPTVQSVRRQLPVEKSTSATTVTFRVTFSEPVTGVDAADFTIPTESGSATGVLTANGVAPSTDSIAYDVTVTGITSKGELRLDVKAGGTGIADAAGNVLQEGFTGGQSYTIVAPPTGSQVLTRGPYLQMASQTAVTLRWRTKTTSDTKVEAGTTFGTYTETAYDPALTTEHEIRISNLKAGTRYFYRFGSSTLTLQSGEDNYFTTAPAARHTGKMRVAVMGDCGINKNGVQPKTLAAYQRYVGSDPAELLLLLGDNAYQDGTDAEFQSNFFNVYGPGILKNHVVFPAPGNHDYHTTSTSSRSAPYYKIFTLPTKGESGGIASGTEGYYSYDWGNIHFISLDSEGTEGPDNSSLSDTLGPQVSWVKKDLAANTLPWVIVYWHHPPYSMGSHNSDTEDQMADIRKNFIRILERNGVDLVLTGHSHNYERSYLLKNYTGTEASFSPSQHTASSASGKYNGTANSCPYFTSQEKTNHGTIYVVAGSAGQVGGTQSKWPHNAMPFSDNKGGMLYLEVQQNRLDAKYLRTDGVIWDQFTIMKDVNKTTEVTAEANGTAQLTASWVGSYQWSTGETTRTITVTPGSETTYQVTDSTKCLTDNFMANPTQPSGTLSALAAETPARGSDSTVPQVFPTLVSRGTKIKVQTSHKDPLIAEVFDINGRLVYTTECQGTTYLATEGLPLGLYLIRLQGNQYLKTWKVIIRE